MIVINLLYLGVFIPAGFFLWLTRKGVEKGKYLGWRTLTCYTAFICQTILMLSGRWMAMPGWLCWLVLAGAIHYERRETKAKKVLFDDSQHTANQPQISS